MEIPEHFHIAKRFGFHYLEFGIGGGHPGRLSETLTQEQILAFKALGREHAIKTPFCCIENDFTLKDVDAHESMVERTTRSIRLAARCGATHVRLFAGFTPADQMTEATWKRMLQAFERCGAVCRGLGLQISIETHGAIEFHADGSAAHTHSATTDPKCLARLVRELPRAIGFNYDPGNLKAVNPDDRTHALDLLDERINYCHLKDWRREGEGWVACAVGDDDLDYASLLKKMKFDGVYLIEYEPLADTEDGIRRSLEYLKKLNVDLRFA